MSWTDEQVATLTKLWVDGLSASQIAKQLGGVSRNAVIGKVHRLGLAGRAAPSQPARPAFKAPRLPSRAAPLAPRPVAPIKAPPAPALAAPTRTVDREEPGAATVLTVGPHMCKWPIGDPLSDSFTFCARRAPDGRPYCGDHAQKAYQPRRPPRRKSPHDTPAPRRNMSGLRY